MRKIKDAILLHKGGQLDQELVESLPRFGRDKDKGRIGHEGKIVHDAVKEMYAQAGLKEKGVNLNLININYIYMFTSLETCLQRNALREGRARVPEKTIEEMYKSLREPEPDEPVKNVYIVNEHRQCIDIKFMNAKDTNNFEF